MNPNIAPLDANGKRVWRGLEGLTVFAWAILLAFGPVTMAYAHSVDQFWGPEWANQDRGTSKQHFSVTEEVPGTTSSATWPLRVYQGSVRWNNVDIVDPDMSFGVKAAIVANYSPYNHCGSDYFFENGMHYRDVAGDSLAVTIVCTQNTIWGDQIRNYQMVFDPNATTWYTGSDPDAVPSGSMDLIYVASHEFGHAAGGWSDDTPGGHYDSANNSLLCGIGVPVIDRHTMCASATAGRTLDSRALEYHDVDVFIEVYDFGG